MSSEAGCRKCPCCCCCCCCPQEDGNGSEGVCAGRGLAGRAVRMGSGGSMGAACCVARPSSSSRACGRRGVCKGCT